MLEMIILFYLWLRFRFAEREGKLTVSKAETKGIEEEEGGGGESQSESEAALLLREGGGGGGDPAMSRVVMEGGERGDQVRVRDAERQVFLHFLCCM